MGALDSTGWTHVLCGTLGYDFFSLGFLVTLWNCLIPPWLNTCTVGLKVTPMMKNITINVSKNHVTEVVIEYRISQQISTHESRSRISGGLEDISLETWSRLSGGGVFEDIRG